jgi:Pentapeptide repeats (8 copies)
MGGIVRRVVVVLGECAVQMVSGGGTYWPTVIGFLRRHPLLMRGVFALLAMMIVLWSLLAWLRVALTLLERHLPLVGVLGGGLTILMLLWGLPKWQAARLDLPPKERFELENEARKTLAQIIGGAVLIAGLFFTWVNLKITQETATKNQELTREGQITERFTHAVDQLGAIDQRGTPKRETRMGGIYALERIARDSKRDHWPIMQFLTAYVRLHAPWDPMGTQLSEPDDPIERRAPDIQAALDVLGWRTRAYEQEDERLSLWHVNLYRAHLSWANLERAYLGGANLRRADLRHAHLQRVDFWGAYLENADFEWANLLTFTKVG